MDDKMFVIVNKSRPSQWRGEARYPVMGHDTTTMASLDEAIACAVFYALEYGHTLETMQVCKLVPVEVTGEMQERFEAEVRAAEEEWPSEDAGAAAGSTEASHA
jgi:hypothetical protein